MKNSPSSIWYQQRPFLNFNPAEPSCVKFELTHWPYGEMSALYKHIGVLTVTKGFADSVLID